MTTMMKCGHAAQSVDKDGNPACVICWPSVNAKTPAVEQPTLEGRMAICTSCGKKPVESKVSLPFFEYRGPGSHRAIHMCKCGYYDVAHNLKSACKCKNFEPHSAWETDNYYCGCQGWN